MIQQRSTVFDQIGEKALDRHVSQGRGLVEIADDLPAQEPQVVYVLLDMVLADSSEDARYSRKGRKQITSVWPGGKSLSHPIHERGQPSKPRQ